MSGTAPRRALRIGITIGLRSADESLWTNGIKQNALYLAKLFQHSPLEHDVRLLNTTDVAVTAALPWDIRTFPTMAFEDGADDLDVLIELGGQISGEQTQRLQSRGAKVVSYCCGAEYVQFMEAMIFRRHVSGPAMFVNERYDDIWMIPQIAQTSRGFFETLRRRSARVVPFVWDPMGIDAACAGFEHRGEYRPRGTAKRVTVVEPNVDVLKFCLYPIFAIERVFRRQPELIDFVHVANAEAMVRDDSEFAAIMRHLDLTRADKITFLGHVDAPAFLAEHTDAVVSHQWGVPLNYFQLECCWLGYPLVHNCTLIDDLGYAYADNDVAGAAERLAEALSAHDGYWETYREVQRMRIARFLASNPALAATYDDLLFGLLNGEGASPKRRGGQRRSAALRA